MSTASNTATFSTQTALQVQMSTKRLRCDFIIPQFYNPKNSTRGSFSFLTDEFVPDRLYRPAAAAPASDCKRFRETFQMLFQACCWRAEADVTLPKCPQGGGKRLPAALHSLDGRTNWCIGFKKKKNRKEKKENKSLQVSCHNVHKVSSLSLVQS